MLTSLPHKVDHGKCVSVAVVQPILSCVVNTTRSLPTQAVYSDNNNLKFVWPLTTDNCTIYGPTWVIKGR